MVAPAIKNYVMGLSLRLARSSQVALFACDNNTFIVESNLPMETGVDGPGLPESTKLRAIGVICLCDRQTFSTDLTLTCLA